MLTILRNFLRRARPARRSVLSAKLVFSVLCALGGLLTGVLAKWLDTIPVSAQNALSPALHVAATIFTDAGVWVFLAVLLGAHSASPSFAALNVFAFLSAMLAAYYVYSARLFGFFPQGLFLFWLGLAALGGLGAAPLWYAGGKGLFAAALAALPVGFLLYKGYPYYYTFQPARLADLAFALALWLVLCKGFRQKAYGAVLSAAAAWLLQISPLRPPF
jgi:hypothetical protein